MIYRLVLASLLAVASPAALAAEWGEYIGKVVAEWMPGGREMKLTEDFSYRDPKGKVWLARGGSIVDGASIPQIAWSLIGGPFEGQYREASVIHDVACQDRKDSWENVHETFYFGMLASGVGSVRAKIMYGAVYHFGPRWERTFKATNVPASDIERRLQTYRSMTDESRRVVATVENRRTIGGGGPLASQQGGLRRETVDIAVRVVPLEPSLREEDFAALRAQIERDDPDLQQIRAYKR